MLVPNHFNIVLSLIIIVSAVVALIVFVAMLQSRRILVQSQVTDNASSDLLDD